MKYDIAEFVEEQIGLGKEQIALAVEREVIRVDYQLRGKQRARARAAGAEPYRRLLCGLGLLLRTGLVPRAASDPAFAAVRPLCEELVGRGQLDHTILLCFGRSAA